MHLRHLSLQHFRNIRQLEIEIPSGPTLLVGANAQGKTSLLEAMHYLVGASSPHTSNDRQLIHFAALRQEPPVARLVGEVEGRRGISRIEIRLVLENTSGTGNGRLRKEILINGVRRRAAALQGGFHAVLFLPQDLRVIEGPPAGRRQVLDEALAQGESGYTAMLQEFTRVLTQRNALLKSLAGGRAEPRELDFWDEKLAAASAGILRARGVAVAELQVRAGPLHSELSRSREALRIDYRPSYDPHGGPVRKQAHQRSHPVAGGPPATDWAAIEAEPLAAGFLAGLQRLRGQEIQRGMTLLGPHRDDLGFWVNEVDLRAYGSRGQNRTAMLALKLAEVAWLRDRTGENPVLLLDEVLAELDPLRRSDLLDRLLDADQAVLTAADLGMFGEGFIQGATVWRIEAGAIRSEGRTAGD